MFGRLWVLAIVGCVACGSSEDTTPEGEPKTSLSNGDACLALATAECERSERCEEIEPGTVNDCATARAYECCSGDACNYENTRAAADQLRACQAALRSALCYEEAPAVCNLELANRAPDALATPFAACVSYVESVCVWLGPCAPSTISEAECVAGAPTVCEERGATQAELSADLQGRMSACLDAFQAGACDSDRFLAEGGYRPDACVGVLDLVAPDATPTDPRSFGYARGEACYQTDDCTVEAGDCMSFRAGMSLCSIPCAGWGDDATCGDTTTCFETDSLGEFLCAERCERQDDCYPGWGCITRTSEDGYESKACAPL